MAARTALDVSPQTTPTTRNDSASVSQCFSVSAFQRVSVFTLALPTFAPPHLQTLPRFQHFSFLLSAFRSQV
jgi:hypothetical protein